MRKKANEQGGGEGVRSDRDKRKRENTQKSWENDRKGIIGITFDTRGCDVRARMGGR